MRSKFLIVYVGVDGDKLSDYKGRPMAAVEMGTEDVDSDFRGNPQAITSEIEEAIFDLTEGTAEGPMDRERLFAVIPLEDAVVFKTKAMRRVDVLSRVGGAL